MNETFPNCEQPLFEYLELSYPDIARKIINENTDLAPEDKAIFIDNPDDPLNHSPEWHQYGIIKHSILTAQFVESGLFTYLQNWGVDVDVNTELNQQIGNRSKYELLRIAALLHDIGKFVTWHGRSTTFSNFKGHETESGRLIRSSEPVKSLMSQFDVTDDQIEYIATCTEVHYELGKLRSAAKETNTGYDLAWCETPEFDTSVQQIIDSSGAYALEVGLMFLSDSVSKCQLRVKGRTDAELSENSHQTTAELQTAGLPSVLLSQALQTPVNIKVAELYLRKWRLSLIT